MTNWVFQLNPKRFDIKASDENERPLGFEVARYRDQLHAGDGAAIWRSGPDAGIIGIATLAANEAGAVDIYQDVIKPGTGWLNPDDFGRRRWFVKFCDGHWLYEPILKSVLEADERFEEASILRNPHQANPFKLTDDQWAAITSQLRDV
jgi:EVE domain